MGSVSIFIFVSGMFPVVSMERIPGSRVEYQSRVQEQRRQPLTPREQHTRLKCCSVWATTLAKKSRYDAKQRYRCC